MMTSLAILLAACALVSPESARRFGAGFVRDGDAYVCSTVGTVQKNREAGVSWRIDLNQSEPQAIRFAAEGVADEMDDAARAQAYLDVTYADGSHLWGANAQFDPALAAGWHRREVTVRPKRPIAFVTAYLFVRGGEGRMRFRAPRFETLPPETEPRLDGVPVGRDFREAGFLVRDFPTGTWARAESANLAFASSFEKRAGARIFTAEATSASGRDRAVTLLYALPLPEGELVWFNSPRLETKLDGLLAEQSEAVALGCGGGLTPWPFGAVAAGGRGIAIGIDPETPCVYRVAASPAVRTLYIAFDLGLAPERNAAKVRFAVFPFAAKDGFRGALESYARLYPEAYRVRTPKQGNWMAFHSISNLPHFEDFGFAFKEGTKETAWDDAHGILTLYYNEPATWWMKLGKPGEGAAKTTRAACVAEAHRLATLGDRAAKAWETGAVLDARGVPYGEIRDTPWCNGIVWSLNCAPGLPGPHTDFKRKMGDAELAARYGAEPPPFPQGIDGEYVDSANLPVMSAFDFDRTHFAAMATPLGFSADGRIGIFKLLLAAEYVRGVGERMHARGRLAMANTTPVNSCLLAFHLDVMGIETHWRSGGAWTPMSDEEMMYRRAVCFGKPFCFLQNTDFTKFGYEDSRRYMEKCLAYGMFPSYFSANAATGHYFSQPALYERDRPLFRKYLPLVKRIAEAGWRPVNRLVRSADPQVYAEQFGDRYVTVFNPSAEAKTAELCALSGDSLAHELVEGGTVDFKEGVARLELPAEGVRVLQFEDN